jgi:hypothetical protein
VTSQTATSVAGTFEADCAGGITVSGTAQGQLVNSTTVPIVVNGTANLPGITGCAFSLSGTGTIENNGNTLRIPYGGNTCMGPVHGTEVLRKATAAPPPPPPPPPPTPTPTPPPVSAPPSGDGINLNQAAIFNSPPDLGNWARTATITSISFSSGLMYVDFDKRDGSGRWPDITPPGWDGPLQYTLGICFNIGGQWDCSAAIQYWYGRPLGVTTNTAVDWFYDPIRWGPMTGYQPSPGEIVGIFVVAGNARNVHDHSGTYVLERSNVVLLPFGSNYTASSLSRRTR